MAYEHKPGSFALFKNDKKGNDKAPDYAGDGADLEGRPIRVAAWLKQGAKGKFMACRMEPPRSQQATKQNEPPKAEAPKSSGHFDDMADDLPF